MNAISYSKITKSFTDMMVRVCEDHEPLIVTHQKSPPCCYVIIRGLQRYGRNNELIK